MDCDETANVDECVMNVMDNACHTYLPMKQNASGSICTLFFLMTTNSLPRKFMWMQGRTENWTLRLSQSRRLP
jgi:hypothetical protein